MSSIIGRTVTFRGEITKTNKFQGVIMDAWVGTQIPSRYLTIDRQRLYLVQTVNGEVEIVAAHRIEKVHDEL